MSLYEAFKDAARTWLGMDDRDLRAENARLQEENAQLREEVRGLQEKLTARESLSFEHNVYWDGDGRPHCPTCYHKDAKAVPMQTERRQGVREYHCPACHGVVDDPRDVRQAVPQEPWPHRDY